MQKGDEFINSEFRNRLQAEFSRRMRVNERYSIRAFASHLEIDSSTLSQILNGRRNLSQKKIAALCEKIGIKNPLTSKDENDFAQIELDTFAVISDWYHFAILDLTLLKNFRSDANWIARKLSISSLDAVRAIDRLKRLGLIVEKRGRLQKGKEFYSNYAEGTTSAALKEYQRQVIKMALHAIDRCPQERKDITSMTIAADSSKLAAAKDKIKNFRRELCAFLENGESDSVYHLTMQLYPVTDLEN